MIPARLVPRVARVIAVLRTAFSGADRSDFQMGLFHAVRDAVPGAKVRFTDGPHTVRPTTGYDEAVETICTVIPRRGDEFQVLFRLQRNSSGYFGAASLVTEAAPVVSAHGVSVDDWVARIGKAMRRSFFV